MPRYIEVTTQVPDDADEEEEGSKTVELRFMRASSGCTS